MTFKPGNKLYLLRKKNSGWKHSESECKRKSEMMRGKMPKNLSLINANKKGSGNPMWGKKNVLELDGCNWLNWIWIY